MKNKNTHKDYSEKYSGYNLNNKTDRKGQTQIHQNPNNIHWTRTKQIHWIVFIREAHDVNRIPLFDFLKEDSRK